MIAVVGLARLVPKPELGAYQQLGLIYGFVAPLLLGGIPAGLLYFVPRARSKSETRAWIFRAYVLVGIFGVAASLVTVSIRYPLASLLHNPELASALVPYAPYVAFAFLATVAPSALVASGHPRAAAAANASLGASVLLAVIVAALIAPDARSLAVGISAGGAIGALISVLAMVRTLRLGPHRELSEGSWRELLRFGLPLALASLAGAIAYQFDRAVIGANYAPRLYAIYAVGAIELPLSSLAQGAIGNALAPALTTLWRDGQFPEAIRLWREAIRKSALLMAPMGAFMVVETPDIIRLLFGPQFAGSGAIFRIYLLFLPLRIATWGLIPQAVGRPRINLLAGPLSITLNVSLALALIGPLGMKGPALAGPLSDLMVATYYLVWIRHLFAVGVRSLVPWRQVALCFGVSACTAATLLPLQATGLGAAPRLLLALCLFTPAVLGILRLLGLLSDDDWSRLTSAITRPRLTP
jgi:O-antigen/teichoic acid export membrane protein